MQRLGRGVGTARPTLSAWLTHTCEKKERERERGAALNEKRNDQCGLASDPKTTTPSDCD